MSKVHLQGAGVLARRIPLVTAIFALILSTVITVPATASAGKLPESCAQVRQQQPAAADGEYTLNLQGHSAQIFCADMAGTPKEYISLAHTGGAYNYSFSPGAHVVYNTRNYLITGTDAHTHYRKIRIDPTTLVVDQKDVTFADLTSIGANGHDPQNPNFNPTPRTADYAVAGDCYNLGSARGRANVDMTGTEWAIEASVEIKVQGWAANGSVTIDPNRQVVNMTGGGWCGGAGPTGPLKLKPLGPLVPTDSTPPAIVPTVTGAQGQNGWYTSDVTVSWSVSDDESAVSSKNGCDPTTLTADTAGLDLTCTAASDGGQGSKTVTIKRDVSAPVTTVAAPSTWQNKDVPVTFTPTDILSGVAATYYTVDSGPQQTGTGLTIATEGTHTLTYWSVDQAGNSETTHSVSVQIDKSAPTTTATATQPNANGWNKTDVSVTLAATDTLSGVGRTEYNLDGAGWVAYGAAIPVTAEGIHTLLYRSVDQADNMEAVQTLTVRIDKTAPEAYLQFDAVSRDLQLFGRDATSGVGSPGPIAPTSVVRARKGEDERGLDDRHEVDGNAELRTYLVKDSADNTLQVVVAVKKDSRAIKATVVSLQYNGGPVNAQPGDSLSAAWSVAKNGTLKELNQQLSVRDGRTGHSVNAQFSSTKNVTYITSGGSDNESDGQRNGQDHNNGEHSSRVTLAGMVFLRMTTAQGKLLIEVPGL